MTADGAQPYGLNHRRGLDEQLIQASISLINPLEASVFRPGRLLASLGLSATLLLGVAQATLAGSVLVDTSVLVPPPPAGAECQLNGPWTVCKSGVSIQLVNEPVFDLPCGTVYQTSVDVRSITRWYSNSELVRRHVYQRAEGAWSLSSTGADPRVTFIANANWGEVYTVPGELSSNVGHQRGTDLLAKSPDGGVVAQISGQTHLNRDGVEQFDGTFRWIDGPVDAAVAEAVADALCEALGS